VHCFLLRGRATVTFRFDPDEPGADVVIADALEVCASVLPEHDSALLDLLEGCEAARYSLARMGHELRGELASALESIATCEALSLDDAATVARCAARLSEWGAGDGTGIILEYAAGPELRGATAAALPAAGADIPIGALQSFLWDALSLSSASLAEVLSAAASSVPRAIALLRSRSSSHSAHIAASAQVAPPPVRLRHLCAALDAPRASARATKVLSTELVLSGVLLADMAGVMSDLADPLSQRVFPRLRHARARPADHRHARFCIRSTYAPAPAAAARVRSSRSSTSPDFISSCGGRCRPYWLPSPRAALPSRPRRFICAASVDGARCAAGSE